MITSIFYRPIKYKYSNYTPGHLVAMESQFVVIHSILKGNISYDGHLMMKESTTVPKHELYPEGCLEELQKIVVSHKIAWSVEDNISYVPFQHTSILAITFLKYMIEEYTKTDDLTINVPNLNLWMNYIEMSGTALRDFHDTNMFGKVKYNTTQIHIQPFKSVEKKRFYELLIDFVGYFLCFKSYYVHEKIVNVLRDMLKYTGETEHKLRKDPKNKNLCEKYEMITLRVSYALALLYIKKDFVDGRDTWPVTYRRIILLLFSGLDGSVFEKKTDPQAPSVAEFLEQILSYS